MIIQPAVKQETLKIAVGTAILSALMLIVFALIGKFDYTVFWGTLLGAAFAVGNFFVLGLSVQKAAAQMHGVQAEESEQMEADDADKHPLSPQAQAARKKMQISYTGRMLLMVGIAVLALTLPCFNAVAAMIAMFFPRVLIFIQGIAMNHKKEG